MISVGAATSNLTIVNKAVDYTAAPNDLVIVDASTLARTITLPASPQKNVVIGVKKNDLSNNAVTVLPGAGSNINGDSSVLLVVNGASVTMQYDGTAWQILSTAMVNAPASGTSGSGIIFTPVATSANYNVNPNEFVNVTTSTNDVTITLPSSATLGSVLAVRKLDNGTGRVFISGTTLSGSPRTLALAGQVTIFVRSTAAAWSSLATGELRFQGPYSSTTTYGPGDIVTSGGVSFVFVWPNPLLGSSYAPTSTASPYWVVLNQGPGLIPTSSKTGNYTAAAGELVLVSTGTSNIVITLPSDTQGGTMVGVKKTDAGSGVVSVSPSIEGATATLTVQGATLFFVFDGISYVWRTHSSTIPAGGAKDQVLTKASNSNFDTTWTTPSTGGSGGGGMFYPWAGSGRVFVGPPITAGTFGQTLQTAQTFQTFWPVRIPNACTIASVSVICPLPNYSGYTFYLGLYADSTSAASGGPGVRLGSAPGSFSSAGYAPSTALLSPNVTFSQATNIWVAFGHTYGSSLNILSHGASTTGAAPTSYMIDGLTTYQAGGVDRTPACRYSNNLQYGANVTDASSYAMVSVANATPLFLFKLA